VVVAFLNMGSLYMGQWALGTLPGCHCMFHHRVENTFNDINHVGDVYLTDEPESTFGLWW